MCCLKIRTIMFSGHSDWSSIVLGKPPTIPSRKDMKFSSSMLTLLFTSGTHLKDFIGMPNLLLTYFMTLVFGVSTGKFDTYNQVGRAAAVNVESSMMLSEANTTVSYDEVERVDDVDGCDDLNESFDDDDSIVSNGFDEAVCVVEHDRAEHTAAGCDATSVVKTESDIMTGEVTGVDLLLAQEDARAPLEVCDDPLVGFRWMVFRDKLTFDGPTDFLMEVGLLDGFWLNVVLVFGVTVLFTFLE